ncbi:MAG: hypothetical protein Kow0029_18800 [Candidatus Rifleibacteriota bacterium]
MTKILKISDLQYCYAGKHRILEDINLEIDDNEIFVMLGHNGAGKTTLIRFILDFMRGYQGKIELFGHDPREESARKKVGFMSEQPVIYDYETAEGYLHYFAGLAEIENVDGRINELMQLTGLIQHKDKKLCEYSKGMLQRLNLARSLLNDPDLLILDEPVIGLDPLGQDLVERVVKSRKEAGKSVFINTHAVKFAAKLADRVGFLMGGRLKKIFHRIDFEKGEFPYIFEIEFSDAEVIKDFSQDFDLQSRQELTARFLVKNREESNKLLERIVSSGSSLLYVSANQDVLEKAFIEYSQDLSLEDRAK